MSIFSKRPWVKLGFAILVIVVVYFLLRVSGLDLSGVQAEELKVRIRDLGLWGGVFFVFLYQIRPLFLIPGIVFSALAGALWGMTGLAYLLIARVICFVYQFFVSRTFARHAVERFLKGKAEKIHRNVREHGFMTVLLVRLIPNAPWDVQNLVFGLSRVRFKDYFLATFLGILPGSVAGVYFGASIMELILERGDVALAVGLSLAIAAIFLLRRVLRKKEEKILTRQGAGEPAGEA